MQISPHNCFRFRSGLRTNIQWAMSFPNYKDPFTGQLAWYTDASLKVFTEHRFVLKAREQYRRPTGTNTRPNTNTTKNPKDKSVIGEPSRQTTLRTKCLRCHQYGHVAAQCPTRSLLIEDAGLDKGNLEDVYEPDEGTSDIDKEVRLSNMRVSLNAFKQHVETRIGRDLVCSTHVVHDGKNYKVMIDGGSCVNIIAKTSINKIGLKVELHP